MKTNLYYIHYFYTKLKSNSLPDIQLYSWTQHKPFFKVQDEINFINNNKPIETPSEPIESMFTAEDPTPLNIELSPELKASIPTLHENLPPAAESIMAYATWSVFRYSNKWVVDEIIKRIIKSDELKIGEHLYGPSIYPRFDMDFDQGEWFNLAAIQFYDNFNATNSFAKIWLVIFMAPLVYIFTMKSMRTIKFVYNTIKSGDTPNDDYYMNKIFKPIPDYGIDPLKDINIPKNFTRVIMTAIDEDFDTDFFDPLTEITPVEEVNFDPEPIAFETDVADDYYSTVHFYEPNIEQSSNNEEDDEDEDEIVQPFFNNEFNYPIV